MAQTRTRKQLLFPLGRLVATPGALSAFEAAGDEMLPYLARHMRGDWGDVDLHDWHENEFSLKRRLRLMSVYHLRNGTRVWIITEADRSVTTVLLPEDY